MRTRSFSSGHIRRRVGAVATSAMVASLCLAGLSAPAQAHVSDQVARLRGGEVVPSGAPKGEGLAEIRSASEISTVCYKLRFENIGKATAAHIHQGNKGEVGEIAVTFFEGQARPSPQDGCVRPVSPGLIEAMQTHPASYYVDVHTGDYPNGAIRGQMKNVAGSYSPSADCGRFRPVRPESTSGQAGEAPKAKVRRVTDAATEKYPVKLRYGFGTSLWEPLTRQPIVEDTAFFNVQVDTADVSRGLYAEVTWADPATDIDLLVYDGMGRRVAASEAISVSPAPVPVEGAPVNSIGVESIAGLSAADCSGYTIELRAIRTLGEDVQLKVWLGEER